MTIDITLLIEGIVGESIQIHELLKFISERAQKVISKLNILSQILNNPIDIALLGSIENSFIVFVPVINVFCLDFLS